MGITRGIRCMSIKGERAGIVAEPEREGKSRIRWLCDNRRRPFGYYTYNILICKYLIMESCCL